MQKFRFLPFDELHTHALPSLDAIASWILYAGMPGRITQMGREEFAELVQSSIQDCQVRTSNDCCGPACLLAQPCPHGNNAKSLYPLQTMFAGPLMSSCMPLRDDDAWLVPGEEG